MVYWVGLVCFWMSEFWTNLIVYNNIHFVLIYTSATSNSAYLNIGKMLFNNCFSVSKWFDRFDSLKEKKKKKKNKNKNTHTHTHTQKKKKKKKKKKNIAAS